MDAVRLTTALRVSGREGRLGVVEVVDVDGEDPVIVAAAGAAVGAAVMVEVLGAEAGSATNLSSVDLKIPGDCLGSYRCLPQQQQPSPTA